jgi:uncharacterized phosphosugar-binding protein
MLMGDFLYGLTDLLTNVTHTQDEPLEAAATRMADALEARHLVHLFGSGHSVLPTQDAFPRYGGYVGLHPLNDPRVMWHNVLGPGGVRELLWLERTEGYIERFLSHEPLRAGDVLIAISHGGRNAAAIEASMYARERGMYVVGITSKANYARPAEHSSGRRLADVVDQVIDTGVPIEDALVSLAGWSRPVGGASTIVAMAIVQELNARAAQKLAQRGIELPTFVSPTVPGASLQTNEEVFDAHEALLADIRQEMVAGRRGTPRE